MVPDGIPQARRSAAERAAPVDHSATATERLRSLTDLARSLAAIQELSQVVVVAAEESRKALDARLVSVLEYIRPANRLRVLINHGDMRAGEERFPDDEWYTPSDFSRFLAEECPLPWTASVDDEGECACGESSLKLRGHHSTLTAPIFFGGRVWGKLYVARDAGSPPYGPGDLEFATALAALVSAGLAQVGRHEQLARLAYTDPLTGLGNRRTLEAALDDALESHVVARRTLALIICDVNGLKQVNDTAGHEAGDEALRAVGGILSTAASRAPGALAARIGGDEFAVLVAGQPLAAVEEIAVEIIAGTAAIPGLAGVACGVAATDGPAGPVSTHEELFRLADAAQYDAKHGNAVAPVVAGPQHRRISRQAPVRTATPERRQNGRGRTRN